MFPKFYLTVQDQAGINHQIQYQLANNPIAEQWFKKIKHIWRIPPDDIYTTTADHNISKDSLNGTISLELESINNIIGKIYDIKTEYTQNDCNLLHAFTVSNQYSYSKDVRDILHRLHRTIHRLESVLSGKKYNEYFLPGEWGEAAGPLTTPYTESSYQYYTKQMKSGTMYHLWAEFGKTPYEYWRNQDSPDATYFINNCRPHVTCRPGFSLCIKDTAYNTPDPNFEQWFNKYRDIWQVAYGTDPESPYSLGGVELAKPIDNQFDYLTAFKITSIKV
jgi:hypothetical protein